jgi:ABC-2 type transport system permease protein
MPTLAHLGVLRAGVELKTFFRNRQAMFFTFLLPILFLLLFGTIFHGKIEGSDVDFRQYFMAGIMASGVFGCGFSSLAIGIAQEQDNGALKRLAGTPMPSGAYFIGKLGMVVVAAFLQAAIVLLLGVALFGVSLPDSADRWLTFLWVFTLGSIGSALLGIAYSRVIKNAKAAAAVVQPPYLALQFMSGVYFVYSQLPKGLRAVAALFPLKWMAQGLRSVFLPESFASSEPAGSWQHGETALVLVAWTIGGFLLTRLFFRWRGRDDD